MIIAEVRSATEPTTSNISTEAPSHGDYSLEGNNPIFRQEGTEEIALVVMYLLMSADE